jgi:hypothetical protein
MCELAGKGCAGMNEQTTGRKRGVELRPRAARQAPGYLPTQLDRTYLALISRYRYAGVPQVAAHFVVTQGAAESKLRRLVRAGMLTPVPDGYRGMTLFVPTPAGRRVSGTGLGRPSGGTPGLPQGFAEATVGHTLGVLRLGIKLERQVTSGRLRRVVTEREIRMYDQTAPGRASRCDPQWAAVQDGGSLHFPDLVVEQVDGRLWAVEWEARQKNDHDLCRVLRSFRDAGHLAGVLYACGSDAIAARVEREGALLGLGERLLTWRPSQHGLPPT